MADDSKIAPFRRACSIECMSWAWLVARIGGSKGQGTIDWSDIVAMYVVTVPARVLGHEKCLQ